MAYLEAAARGALVAGAFMAPGLLAGQTPHSEIVGAYAVTIENLNADHANVVARIRVRDGRLFAGFGGAFSWRKGWGDFVEGMEAKTLEGQPLLVSEQGERESFHWILSTPTAPYDGEVAVSYQVNLRYLHQQWDFGNEQAGIVLDRALYTVTKPLFVSSDVEGRRTVRFEVPPDWKVAVPWKRLANRRTFEVPDSRTLQNNTLLLGDFGTFEFRQDGFSFTLALPGPMKDSRDLLSRAMDRVLPLYMGLFRDTPPVPYLMTVYYADVDDGEAFSNGATFTTTLPVSEHTSILWANFLAHELFHFWNGQRLRGDPRWERQWFSEGFTEYYANLALVNTGLIGQEGFIKKMEHHLANYFYFLNSPLFEEVSLRDAGKRKGRNRMGVYSGGWAVAFVLDRQIRTASNGTKSLDDYMRMLFTRFGRKAETYSFEDLAEVLVTVGGARLQSFLEEHVDQRTPLPVQDALGLYGLVGLSKPYANEFYILQDAQATDTQIAEWRWLTQERFGAQLTGGMTAP